MIRALFICSVSLFAAGAALANWPNYLGVGYAGTADNTELVDTIDDSLNAIWKVDVGPGFGGTAVEGNEVFLLDRIVGEQDVLRVFDLKSGEELYRIAYDAPGRLPFSGSRSVPAVKDDFVYTSGGFGHAACFNRTTREIVWIHDLAKDFGGEVPRFGYSTHPVVYRDLVIYAPLGQATGLIAFNRRDGQVVWQTEGVYSSTSSPVIHSLSGMDQCLFLSSSTAGTLSPDGPRYVTSFDPSNGTLLWRFDGFDAGNPIPAVAALDDRTLVLTAGYEAGTTILDVRRSADKFKIERIATLEKGSQLHTPIQFENHIYLIVNENSTLGSRSQREAGGLMCMTREGDVKWRTGDNPNFGRGGMVLADGKLIIQDGNSGIIHLVKPNPDAYQELGRANVFGTDRATDHQMWAPPAISGGFLLVRSQEILQCLDLRRSQ